jgi:myo-inositol-1(or 4)-monophosphatase
MFSKYTHNCINLAKKAGSELKNGFNTKFEVNSKTRINDLVTEYDLIAEKVVIEEIKNIFPDHSILAEESGLNDNESEYQWIIDPLDGTVNFANKLGIFSVSIALKYKNNIISGCVYNPISEELFFAEFGKGAYLNEKKINVSNTNNINTSFLVTGFPYNINENPKNCLETFTRIVSKGIPVRRLGSAALDLCFVAAGRFDGYWEVSLKPWDMAAGKLILEEAGGKVTHYDGTIHEFKQDSIIASNTLIHNQLIGLVNNEN